MSIANLTAKYRPQRFDEAAGQDAIKRILSRAAVEDRIAPAYLFSGTRGVGKTTLARVFAKAVNCLTAPTAEPCNECRNCRQITAGVAPDVVEIDAATHGGVDEARRLKEDIGYAPLECRYKVFIIDEAHMLSKAAFNALLKTLEEPPGRVTFIMATTEPHKFPATIVSRCQHYIFKRLTQAELESHLAKVLASESIAYEPGAVSILARRGAGSVRDSMSLMGQVLASGAGSLTEADTREILGLAGQDVFFSLIEAIHGRDCLAVDAILRQVLDKGLDLGFFLRELTGCWRNMFILAQAGDKALSLLDSSAEEAAEWLRWSARFPLAHIHACWQLSLEGQRRVMQSLEPALALELLLLNLAYLPMLVPLERAVAGECLASGDQAPARAPSAPRPAGQPRPVPQTAAAPPDRQSRPAGYQASYPSENMAGQPAPQTVAPRPAYPSGQLAGPSGTLRETAAPQAPAAHPAQPQGSKSWNGFLRHCEAHARRSGEHLQRVKSLTPKLDAAANTLTLTCLNDFHRDQLSQPDQLSLLEKLVQEYYGPGTAVALTAPKAAAPAAPPEELRNRDAVKQAKELLGAQVIDVKTGRNS